MAHFPKISVIIPAYNANEHLAQALESVLAQKYPNLQILVINDASTDHTRVVAQQYGKFIDYVENTVNLGITKTRNLGLSLASGAYIAWLDADDVWTHSHLAVLVPWLIAFPHLQLVQGLLQKQLLLQGGPGYEDFGRSYANVNLGTMLFRRSVFDELGGFDEQFSVSEDTEFWLRLRACQIEMRIVPHTVLLYRQHVQNTTLHLNIHTSQFIHALRHSLLLRRSQTTQASDLPPLKQVRLPNLCWTTARPLVSVIVPSFNRASMIGQALDSIFAQSYPHIEVIVVDDGSTDQTREIVQSYAGVCYHFQPNQGAASARNAGLQQAQGEFIAFLDSDDVWESEKLIWQIELLLARPYLDFVLGQVQHYLDEDTPVPKSWVRPSLYLQPYNGYLLSCLLAKRTCFTQVGEFDATYRVSEDADWFFRARDAGLQSVVLQKVVLHRKIHHGNLTHRTQEIQRTLLQLTRSSLQRKRLANFKKTT
jgi:glycosyltransferase involved in cell wall biosynthesis